jgi:hypothetical protein
MLVDVAEALLEVNFRSLSHPDWPHPVVRADRSYTVPEDIAPHLDFGEYCPHLSVRTLRFLHPELCAMNSGPHADLALVGNVHRVPSFKIRPTIQDPVPIIGVTPNVLRGRYNLTRTTVGKAHGNSQVVYSVTRDLIHSRPLRAF